MTTSGEKRLCHVIGQLSVADQQVLLAFAEFLHARAKPIEPVEPQIIPRPPKESVVAAIKRLSHSYPMLDKAKMLDETSTLMTDHIMRGRDAVYVIDELEKLFLRHYNTLVHERRDE